MSEPQDPKIDAIKELRQIISDYSADSGMPDEGQFFYFFGLGQVNRTMRKQDPNWAGYGVRQDAFCERMFILGNDFHMLVTILHKIRWTTLQWQKGLLSEDDWQAYVKADVHAFHVEFRSILDSVCQAISIAASKPNQLPQSFSTLKTQCEKSERVRIDSLITAEFADLIASLDWFDQIKSFRDYIVHFERDVTLGYSPTIGHLAFKTTVGITPNDVYEGPKEFKNAEGWIWFEPYAGYYLGRLWDFLNKACKLCGDLLSLERSNLSWIPERLSVSMECIKHALVLLEGLDPSAEKSDDLAEP